MCVYLYAHVLPVCIVEVPVCHCAHVEVRTTLVFASTVFGLWFLSCVTADSRLESPQASTDSLFCPSSCSVVLVY